MTPPEIVAVPITPLVRLRRLGFRAGYRVLQVYWFVRRPQTSGVKMLLRWEDQVLFVRHTYGDRGLWEIPGGGRRAHEEPEAAARREALEEVGLDVEHWVSLGDIVRSEFATAHLTCMAAESPYAPVRIDPGEILEARWAPAEHPPEPLGEHARAVLGLAEDSGT